MAERRRTPLVIAHRGASAERIENTMPAYALAVEQGADMIEIDLHLTRDGAVVVAHDERLSGLSGSGAIGDVTLEDVRALDLGGGERVPTLAEVLDAFGAHIPFNLELKRAAAGDYPGLERATLDLLAERELDSSILFSSFSDGVLNELRENAPRARLGVLVSPRAPADWPGRCRAVGAEAVHLSRVLASRGAIEEAHALGLAVYVYTVDDPDEMQQFMARGADGLFTNVPARMRALLGVGYPKGDASGVAE